MRYTRLFIAALSVALMLPAAASAQTASCGITSNLSVGSTGAQVTALQKILKNQGYFTAASSPRFGPATQAAVRAFQKAKGISQTGTVGPQTRAALCGGSTSSSGSSSSAGGSFEVTGWIPYWRTATGTADVLPNLSKLTEVNPFVYTLKSDGSIVDNGKLTEEPWLSFMAQAKAQNVRVIPSIMSSDRDFLYRILSNTQSRVKLEDDIAALVKANNFDGIDIDFENKSAATKPYFSTFLKGLYQRMGNKFVMCTIESRTPLDARYYGTTIPADAEIYANDFVEINKYCDRVRVMTYDQQGIDQQLAAQAASSSQLYAPVADPAWVEKVINLMAKDISKSKLLIGVPTYGYEYDVTAYANNEYLYDILWTFNPGYALQIAQERGITPQRNSAGELFFTYVNTSTSTSPISMGSNSALLAATAASTYATQYNSHLNFRMVDWPDAASIQSKIDLAKRLGVRGISIFKFDGGQDPAIWNVLTGLKK